ncbi:ubiquitin-associated and SH3 domain-containing protein A [Protopterus annectens]|uniref:ubiquitin-associated and SH3 domain-containing protein A n=1 Tax=Protopterus annectens TaxID=7888 RepID=UPI001CF9C386|nr:ubiquitin-associated and SH3 domain-containing protein A [Protopterus annectens]
MADGVPKQYAKVSDHLKSRSTFSLLEYLISIGYSEERALKALAATGRRSSQEASEWLVAHQNDPTLDDPIPQEFILYLCPSGPLAESLSEFWKQSKKQGARNRAHDVFPHITLSDFFTCEDSKVEALYEALKKTGDMFLAYFPQPLSLLLHSSSSYIGFFLEESEANIIKQFAVAFAKEAVQLAECQIKPSTKQIHLTMAHKFHPLNQKLLENLAGSVNPKLQCQWMAALYSRDMRFVHYQTLRAVFPYDPQNADELEMKVGDYIFVDPAEQIQASEGWFFGISHRTGCRGFSPENYSEKVNGSDTWVLHRTYTFSKTYQEQQNGIQQRSKEAHSEDREGSHSPSVMSFTKLLSGQLLQEVPSRRLLLVVRYGERIDQVFGKSWLKLCININGKYLRADLNFPPKLPRRTTGAKDYEKDPPLTCCGQFQSRLTGEALREKGIVFSRVYSSPALCCIETAHHILEGLNISQKPKICIEPGLFEWTKWEGSKGIPNFMSLMELKEANYNVDTSYSCSFPLPNLVTSEGYEDFINRSSTTVKEIVNASRSEGDSILVIGHSSGLDSFTRPVVSLPPKDSKDFADMVRKIPALGMCCCEEIKEESRWQMIIPPIPTLTHGPNAAFNWKETILR